MTALQVNDYINETIEELGADKQVTISYVKPDGENERTEEIVIMEMRGDKLHINWKAIKDGDIKSTDHVVSVGNKELNIQLWIKEYNDESCEQPITEKAVKVMDKKILEILEEIQNTQQEHTQILLDLEKKVEITELGVSEIKSQAKKIETSVDFIRRNI